MIIFTLLPESNPVNVWMKSNLKYQDDIQIQSFIKQMEIQYKLLNIEDYEGYYDSLNVQNFLSDFEITADYYPNPVFHLVRKYLSAFEDFRAHSMENKCDYYFIYNQSIRNLAFSEIAERQIQTKDESCILINYDAHNLGDNFKVTKNTYSITIESVTNCKKLHQWLSSNRNKVRNFQIIEKHGENRSDRYNLEKW